MIDDEPARSMQERPDAVGEMKLEPIRRILRFLSERVLGRSTSGLCAGHASMVIEQIL